MNVFDNNIVTAVVAWLGGILAAVLVQQVLNRRSVLSYFVTHSKVGVSVDDRTFGTVQITLNGTPVPNLYLSTIELTNESSRDLENLKIQAFSPDTTLLSEFPQLMGTTHYIKYSPEYERQITVAAGTEPTQNQREVHGQGREYVVPVLNRGQVIRFQYLNVSKSEKQPNIWLEIVHPGVLLRFRPPQNQVLGVPQAIASLTGALLGILLVTLLCAYRPVTWVTAFVSLIFGFGAQLPGAYAVRAFRKVRSLLTG